MTPLEIVVIIMCVLVVGGVAFGAIIRKKKGKSSCGSGCAGCPYAGSCRTRNGAKQTTMVTSAEATEADKAKEPDAEK